MRILRHGKLEGCSVSPERYQGFASRFLIHAETRAAQTLLSTERVSLEWGWRIAQKSFGDSYENVGSDGGV